MKNLLLGCILLISACTPVRYVYVDPKDSVVVKQRVVYDDIYVPSPTFYNHNWMFPYYNPIIITVPYLQNRYTPTNRYSRKLPPQRPVINPNRLSRPLPQRGTPQKR